MHELHKLKNRLCDELKEYGQRESLTLSDLETVDTLAHAVKNIGKIIVMYETTENAETLENSRITYVRPDGSYAKERYIKSGKEIVSSLRDTMAEIPDEKIKSEIHRIIDRIENM